ncbi:peptide ABC transporter permease [Pseudomonas sp. FW305-E2]|uniref:ABC transporter permease n=1 Tax=Pseudomonas sp. FW305-E2 TaxID=2075558 RepID=UPI000B4E947F|nr:MULTISPECIES: ABC transporter permease [Pseudomonas]POA81641.1 peptide ABC transporter permease [Pseudomonas sp. FW305-E2]
MAGLMTSLMSSGQGRYGLILVSSVLALIIFGPYFAPFDPTAVNLAPARAPMSTVHWLGTDGLGRDVLSRLLCGGQSIVVLPLVSVSIGYVLAGSLTVYASYKGGAIDSLVTRIFEILMAFPTLLKTLLFVAAFGAHTWVLITSLVISTMPGANRVVRAVVLDEISRDYVWAAKTRGESLTYIIFSEIIPNILGPIAADYSLRITWAIIALSTLSFLGLGVQPPTPDWGLMIQEARASLQDNPWAALVPALAIGALSLGFSFLADAISAHWDSPAKR